MALGMNRGNGTCCGIRIAFEDGRKNEVDDCKC